MLSRISRRGSDLVRRMASTAWELNLKELERHLTTYSEEYERRKRNGLAVFELWKRVKHCELLYNKLREWSAEKTDNIFRTARKDEYEGCLKGVTSSVKNAVNFIKEFNMIHAKDEHVVATPRLVHNFTIEREKGEVLARQLERELKAWQENLCREIYGNQYRENVTQFNETIDDQMLEIKQKMLAEKVADFNSSFSSELSVLLALKKALIASDKSEIKIEYLTLVAEDIDAVRHIPNIRRLTNIARQLLSGEIINRLDKKLFVKLFTEPSGDRFEHFGPLGVIGVKKFDMFDFAGSYNSREYIFRDPETRIASTGYLSKFSKLTVGGATRENLNIHPQAAHYCYVYPIKTVPKPCENKYGYEEYLPDYNLLLHFGGYAYFNDNKELLQLNAIHYNGVNVYFGRKMDLSHPSDTIIELRNQRRLHNVPFSEVVAQGVEQYAWLVPGEFDNANHGAFLFTFKDRNIEPCYFELVPHNVGAGQAFVNEQSENEHLGFILMSETLNM